MKTFKAITTVDGKQFVDWYECTNEGEAKKSWILDKESNGLPDSATVVFVECDATTLKPLCVS